MFGILSPHMWGAIPLIIVVEGKPIILGIVFPHIRGDTISLIIVGKRGTYNAWYSTHPHVMGVYSSLQWEKEDL